MDVRIIKTIKDEYGDSVVDVTVESCGVNICEAGSTRGVNLTHAEWREVFEVVNYYNRIGGKID